MPAKDVAPSCTCRQALMDRGCSLARCQLAPLFVVKIRTPPLDEPPDELLTLALACSL